MSILSVLFFIGGLGIITIGAEILLKGASGLATLLGIRPIIIGLTVVSIGTSLPELAVGITAVKEGAGDIAIGNIAGTNLVNILLILGLSAAIRPLPINMKTMRVEVFTMIITAVLLFLLSLDGNLSLTDGVVLLICGLIYTYLVVRSAKQKDETEVHELTEDIAPTEKKNVIHWYVWGKQLLFLVIGILLTIYGAELLVRGAVDIAKYLGWSDAIIGLTIVAIGTSAPELVTTLVATFRNQRDVAVGNLVGSSIMNILFILGITAISSVTGIVVSNDILWFDLPLAAIVAIICYPVFKSGNMVSRKEGLSFMLLYVTYIVSLFWLRV